MQRTATIGNFSRYTLTGTIVALGILCLVALPVLAAALGSYIIGMTGVDDTNLYIGMSGVSNSNLTIGAVESYIRHLDIFPGLTQVMRIVPAILFIALLGIIVTFTVKAMKAMRAGDLTNSISYLVFTVCAIVVTILLVLVVVVGIAGLLGM